VYGGGRRHDSVLMAILKAKARCHLAGDSLFRSCYEAGRDGFWLHRWLTNQGILNLVVDPTSTTSPKYLD
jgi:transposase